MKPNEDIKSLAAQMAMRHDGTSPNPFILFLGTGCARAAGVPSIEEIARRMFSEFSALNPKMATALPPQEDTEDDELLQTFYEVLDGMSSGQRYRMLQYFYTGIAVPLFYQDLAVLVKAGFFSHILTTNIDTLLEQALNGTGLQQENDYQVISLGVIQSSSRPTPSTSDSLIKIIKLHGDLAQQQANITPDEIEAALKSQSRFVKGELKGDIVMVGYEFESEPIDHWLTRTSGGELWWMSSKSPDPTWISSIKQTRQFISINGSDITLEAFFGQLALLLLRVPVLESMATSFEAYSQAPPSASFFFRGIPTRTSLSDDELEVEYLRDQLRRCQEVLYSLEQAAVPGEKNAQLQAQIEYQKRQVAELEDQFRSLSSNRPRVVKLMEQITQSAQHVSIDPDTTSFLQTQVNTVKEEYGKGQPNQHIVSASIGATVVVGERLGGGVVEPELVRELASFAPGTTARRI